MTEWPDSISRRFWRKVDVQGPDECWLWQGSKRPSGHGSFWLYPNMVGAHRMAWALDRSQRVEAPEVVCHACDNPPCCNPAHLYAGTYATNFDDRIERKTGHRPNRIPAELGLEAPKPNPKATLAPAKPEGKWGAPAGSRTQTPRLEGGFEGGARRKTADHRGKET